jgi:hypothetical protein
MSGKEEVEEVEDEALPSSASGDDSASEASDFDEDADQAAHEADELEELTDQFIKDIELDCHVFDLDFHHTRPLVAASLISGAVQVRVYACEWKEY